MHFELAGSRLRLHVFDDCSAQLAKTAFGRLRCVKGPAQFEAWITEHSDELRVEFGDARVACKGHDRFGAAYAAVREVFARFAAGVSSNMAFYGAGWASAGTALALLAPSGTGKTLLALYAAVSGARFCGDESFLLHPSGTLSAVPRLPSLRESALPFLPTEDIRASISSSRNVAVRPYGRLWYALEPSDLGGIAPDQSGYPLGSIIVVEGRSERAGIRPIRGEALLTHMLERAFVRPSRLRDIAMLQRALHGVRGFSMELGKPYDSAELLREQVAA